MLRILALAMITTFAITALVSSPASAWQWDGRSVHGGASHGYQWDFRKPSGSGGTIPPIAHTAHTHALPKEYERR
jgi:hypothetical protein